MMARPITIHALCLASKATVGSLIRPYGPGGFENVVVPGRKPRVEYGVHDDQEILEIARQYFHLSVPER